MNTQFWTVTVGSPEVNKDNGNKADVSVVFAYDDGNKQFSFTDSYSGVQGQTDLLNLIKTNFTAHEQFVDTMLNTPIGVVDLAQMFPEAVPTPTLSIKTGLQAQNTQVI